MLRETDYIDFTGSSQSDTDFEAECARVDAELEAEIERANVRYDRRALIPAPMVALGFVLTLLVGVAFGVFLASAIIGDFVTRELAR